MFCKDGGKLFFLLVKEILWLFLIKFYVRVKYLVILFKVIIMKYLGIKYLRLNLVLNG